MTEGNGMVAVVGKWKLYFLLFIFCKLKTSKKHKQNKAY